MSPLILPPNIRLTADPWISGTVSATPMQASATLSASIQDPGDTHVRSDAALSARTIACIVIGTGLFAFAVYAFYAFSHNASRSEATGALANRPSTHKKRTGRANRSHVDRAVAPSPRRLIQAKKSTLLDNSSPKPSLWQKCLRRLGMDIPKPPRQHIPHLYHRFGFASTRSWERLSSRSSLPFVERNEHIARMQDESVTTPAASYEGHIRLAMAGPSHQRRNHVPANAHIVDVARASITGSPYNWTSRSAQEELSSLPETVPTTTAATRRVIDAAGKEDKRTCSAEAPTPIVAGHLDPLGDTNITTLVPTSLSNTLANHRLVQSPSYIDNVGGQPCTVIA